MFNFSLAVLPPEFQGRRLVYRAYALEWLPVVNGAVRSPDETSVRGGEDFLPLTLTYGAQVPAAVGLSDPEEGISLAIEFGGRLLWDGLVVAPLLFGPTTAALHNYAFGAPHPLYSGDIMRAEISNATGGNRNVRVTVHGIAAFA